MSPPPRTAESIVYREELRELAEGDRIVFTAANRENRVSPRRLRDRRRIGEDNAISARLDRGRAVELDADKARHIDYGYTVESAQHLSTDRVFLTGESGQLAEQRTALTKLNPHTREIAIYTTDRTDPLQQEEGVATDLSLSQEALSLDPLPSGMPQPVLPQVEFQGFELGL